MADHPQNHESSHLDSDMSEDDRERLEGFKQDISDDADLGEEMRDAANEDMRFVNVPGGMWEDFLEDQFSEDRFKPELDLVSNFLQRYIGEWNQNRIGVEFKADDSGTTSDDSELINGRYRFDFRRGSGKLATDNAVDEAATCGVGAMMLATEFENDEDPENDNQIIVWRPIYNAYATIYWDPAAKRIDKRDAGYCTRLEQFTTKAFEKQFPGKKPVSAYTPTNRAFLNTRGASKADVFVASRYEVVKKKIAIFVYDNLVTNEIETYTKEQHDKIKDELKADETRVFRRERRITRQIVEKTVFSGDDILKKTRTIVGKWIPIIPFYGYRSYVDGIETFRGLVRKLKDAARLFNMQMGQLGENAASAGQEVPIFNTMQMLGDTMKNQWADKNNQSYLLVDPSYTEDGELISAGPVGYSKPGALDQSATTLLALVPQFIQDVTGGPPTEAFNGDMSGKALRALVKRENLNTQVVTDNIANAIVWSGTVYQSQFADVYTERRKLQVIGKDNTESDVQLLEHVIDDDTGELVIANDLTGKKFHSYPDAGPQYETAAEQTVEDLKGMMEMMGDRASGEPYMDAMMAIMLENITGVNLDPIKKISRDIMLTKGLIKPITDEEKQLVADAQQPKEDPQAELLEAAATQQEAEAESLRASSEQKLADADKKRAETQEILQDIGLGDRKIVSDQQEKFRDRALRLNGNGAAT